jgi:membrane-associated protein
MAPNCHHSARPVPGPANVGSPVSYIVAVLLPALDALIPWLPSETVVIALGAVTAGSADPRIGLVVLLAALGAFLGDNAAYLVGRRFGPAVDRRLFAGEQGARRRAWAQRSLDRFGMRVIVACRFIPGGRTAVTLTCGLIGYPRRRFVAATAVAGAVWASYAFFLGRLGGKLFEHRPWIGLLLALGLGLGISLLIEAGRRVWRWRGRARQRAHGGGGARTRPWATAARSRGSAPGTPRTRSRTSRPQPGAPMPLRSLRPSPGSRLLGSERTRNPVVPVMGPGWRFGSPEVAAGEHVQERHERDEPEDSPGQFGAGGHVGAGRQVDPHQHDRDRMQETHEELE